MSIPGVTGADATAASAYQAGTMGYSTDDDSVLLQQRKMDTSYTNNKRQAISADRLHVNNCASSRVCLYAGPPPSLYGIKRPTKASTITELVVYCVKLKLFHAAHLQSTAQLSVLHQFCRTSTPNH